MYHVDIDEFAAGRRPCLVWRHSALCLWWKQKGGEYKSEDDHGEYKSDYEDGDDHGEYKSDYEDDDDNGDQCRMMIEMAMGMVIHKE